MRRLIRIFTGRILYSQICEFHSCGQWVKWWLHRGAVRFESSMGVRQKVRFLTLRLICWSFFMEDNEIRTAFHAYSPYIWATFSEKVPSSMRKMCEFTLPCTCAEYHPHVQSIYPAHVQSITCAEYHMCRVSPFIYFCGIQCRTLLTAVH